jgi:hypothetical protein
MTFPQRLTLRNSAYALDGGTTRLTATDEGGNEHTILLIQHAFPQRSPSTKWIPGRLYYDGELIALRSPDELAIVNLLRSADAVPTDVVPTPPPADQARQRIQPSKSMMILGEDIQQVLSRTPDENLRAMLAAVIERVTSHAYVAFAARVGE